MSHFFRNGTIQTEADSRLAHSRVSYYGDGLFETMFFEDGQIRFAPSHFNRLTKSSTVIGVAFSWSYQEFLQKVKAAIKTSGLKSGIARLQIARTGSFGYGTSEQGIDWLLKVSSISTSKPTLFSIDIYDQHAKPVNQLGQIKSCNSLLYVLAANWAIKKKVSEVLILNEAGKVCEASSSNLFVVKNKVIYTPPLSEGPLPGVMREQVIKLIQTLGLELRETPLLTEDIKEADEIFLTNAISGVQPVTAFGPRRFFHKTADVILKALASVKTTNLH